MDDLIFHEQEEWAIENTAEALSDAIERVSKTDVHKLGMDAARAAERSHAWPQVFDRLFCIYREVCANYNGNGAK